MTSTSNRLRRAVIGVGANVLTMHYPALSLPAAELVGVSDINHELGEARAQELGCPFYTDYRRLLKEAWHQPRLELAAGLYAAVVAGFRH